MTNIIYLEAYSSPEDYHGTSTIELSIESLIINCIYKYCSSDEVDLKYVYRPNTEFDQRIMITFDSTKDVPNFIDDKELPWQVSSCVFPVSLHRDTVITGLCAVARHICKYRSLPPSSLEHQDGLLGFRKSCLQAPNEVSIWTKFCEVDLIKTVKAVLRAQNLEAIPKNLVRFENHLHKPVRIHNVYKVAREFKKVDLNPNKNEDKTKDNKETIEKNRQPKNRKWKSKTQKELEINCSTKIEDLDVYHQFAEGPFFTLADLILFPSYYVITEALGLSIFEYLLPLSYRWFNNIINIPEIHAVSNLFRAIKIESLDICNLTVPITEDFSLYKSDPKRHNPKKRLFTKENDIEDALSRLKVGMEIDISNSKFVSKINWDVIPEGANPAAGHLPDERVVRKTQQLENLALAVLSIAKKGDLIVDFCSGSGHLGILIAHLLPNCTIILLENKEQSLFRARERVHKMGLRNVYFFQCNLDFFVGKFDIGVALHACGIASDLVLDKCFKTNAKFVLCPCCYGSLHATDRLVYPRSKKFSEVTIEQYLCIGHTADQTHNEHHLTCRGDKCMAVIDSDRGRLAEEFGYAVNLSRLHPLSCTPKNNLLMGIPS